MEFETDDANMATLLRGINMCWSSEPPVKQFWMKGYQPQITVRSRLMWTGASNFPEAAGDLQDVC